MKYANICITYDGWGENHVVNEEQLDLIARVIHGTPQRQTSRPMTAQDAALLEVEKLDGTLVPDIVPVPDGWELGPSGLDDFKQRMKEVLVWRRSNDDREYH